MAGNNLDRTLQFAVIFYCAVFGSAFFLSSTLFLYSLHRVESSPDGPPQIKIPSYHHTKDQVEKENQSSSSTICTNQINDWKMYANIGLIYGITYIIAAVFQLWPIFDACCIAALKLGQVPSSFSNKKEVAGYFNSAFLPSSSSSSPAAVYPLCENGQTGPPRQSVLGQLPDVTVSARQNEEATAVGDDGDEGGCCESMCKCLYIVVPYMVIVGLWLFSIILPAYLAVVLNSTDAVRVNDERLLWPAVALFITCLVSEAVVFISACVFICLDAEDDGDDQSSSDPGSNTTTIDII